MKKYKINSIIFFIPFLLLIFLFFSLTWNEVGFKILNQTFLEKGFVKYYVEDENNHNFEIIISKDVDLQKLKIIKTINEVVYNLNFIKIKNLKYYVYDNLIDISIIPESVIIDDKNLDNYFPSGIKFYYKEALYYKIKIFTGDNFVEIENKYVDEKDLTELITVVIKDPKKYLTENNLQYLAKKLNRDENIIEEMQKQIKELKKSLEELNSEVQKNKKNIDKKISLLNKYIEYLQDTALTLGNQGLFKGPTKISKNVVEAVINLKSKSSNITVKEIVENLKSQSLRVSEWEVRLILLVFYDEF